jgi:putative endonuclease
LTELSRSAESFACEWLEERGWSILRRNYRTRRSEIDIIASRGDIISFVEVKYASDGSATVALEKIDPVKRSRIVRCASAYLSSHPPSGQVRFDVAVVRGTPEEMRMGEYIPDAFRPGFV